MYLYLVSFLFLFLSCSDEKFADFFNDEGEQEEDQICTNSYTTSYIKGFDEVYSAPKTGLSCDAFTDRERPRTVTYEYDCSGKVEVCAGDVALVNQAEKTSDMTSTPNTEISDVKEARRMDHDSRYTYHIVDGYLTIQDFEGNSIYEEQVLNETNSKLILRDHYLIVKGERSGETELRVFDLSDGNFMRSLFVRFINGSSRIRLRDHKVIITNYTKLLGTEVDCTQIKYLHNGLNSGLTSLYEVDLDRLNGDNLEYELEVLGQYYGKYTTTVLKNNIILNEYGSNSQTVLLNNNAEVPQILSGRIPYSFAVNEKDEHIAVFYNRNDHNDNALLILDQENQVQAQLDGLGQNEQIYSARFFDNTAYLVTFREVDPVYAIDISDITSPRLLSELKIPGFSNYLHAMDEKFLVGIGKTGGSWWSRQGEISLFDTSDLGFVRKIDSLYLPDYDDGHVSTHQNILKYENHLIYKSYNYTYIIKLDGTRLKLKELIYGRDDNSDFLIHDNQLLMITKGSTRIIPLEADIVE